MMKRNILAVIIPAILVAGSVNAAEIYNKDGNKLDLYGKVVGERGFNSQTANKNTGTKKGSSDSSYAQIGFKGETQINSDLVGFGRWEYRAKASKEEGAQDNVTRLAFAGLKAGEAGSLSYGRNYGILYDVESYTDMSPSYSGETWGGGNADNFMTHRSTGVLTYRNTDLFGHVEGLNFGIQYQGKNERNDPAKANGDGLGYSVEYNFAEGFAVNGAYSNSTRTSNQKSGLANGAKHAEAFAFGAKYDANNIYLAAAYAETRNMSNVVDGLSVAGGDVAAGKTENIEMVAQYQFDFGLRPSLGFVHSKGKDLNINGQKVDAVLAKYIQVGTYYYFNKNFNVYGDYRINMLKTGEAEITDGGWVGSDNQATVGVTYQF